MNVILGAGIAGLGAYYADPSMDIFEKDDQPCGLCGGFMVDNFRFDNAIHLSFTDNQFVKDIFDKTELITHKPNPRSWYHGYWLKHPVQNNIFPFSPEEKASIVESFVNRPIYKGLNDFETWLRSQYGDYMYEKLFRPYNEKYWCSELSELSTDWLGNRFSLPALKDVLFGSYTDQTPNAYYAKEMRYPINGGGYQEFLSPIVKKAINRGKLHLNKRVCRIEPKLRKVLFEDGYSVEYEKIYSSIPLPEIIRMIDHVPDRIKEKMEQLSFTGVVLISIGFDKPLFGDHLWFYIYDEDVYASRAYVASNKSPQNAPEGRSSIQFEVYYSDKHSVPEKEKVISNCLMSLRRMGLEVDNHVLFTDYRILSYGNIIFKKNTYKLKAEIREWLDALGIVTIGRFGEWEYLWSDQAFLSGYSAVK